MSKLTKNILEMLEDECDSVGQHFGGYTEENQREVEDWARLSHTWTPALIKEVRKLRKQVRELQADALAKLKFTPEHGPVSGQAITERTFTDIATDALLTGMQGRK
jgi:hypothetical protein